MREAMTAKRITAGHHAIPGRDSHRATLDETLYGGTLLHRRRTSLDAPSWSFAAIPVRSDPPLNIGEVDDPLERHADAAADHIMRMPGAGRADLQDSGLRLRRKCAECEEDEKTHGKLARKESVPVRQPTSAAAPPVVHHVLHSPGRPLDAAARSFFEPRFGRDLSSVRIHTDAHASESARAVNALAYTVGRDIVFDSKQYAPGTTDGRRLIAHELAHVLQQSRTKPPAVERRADDGVGFAGNSFQTQFGETPLTLQRYSHQDCSEEDLRSHIWPADGLARQMTQKSLDVLGSMPGYANQHDAQANCVKSLGGCPNTRSGGVPTPEEIARYNGECRGKTQYEGADVTPTSEECMPGNSPATNPLEELLLKYFRTPTPDLSTIVPVYQKIADEFAANDYQYECEDDCGGSKFGYVWSLWSDIHLCMNHLRGKANACIARTMVHEFSHYYAGTSDKSYCKSGCEYASCPESLSPADALRNADSYACFAYELFSKKL